MRHAQLERFYDLTALMSDTERCRTACALSEERWERLIRAPLRAHCERINEEERTGVLNTSLSSLAGYPLEPCADYERGELRQRGRLPEKFPGGGSPLDDPLKEIPPPLYFERLAGIDVPASGYVLCPVHEERTPSCRVYDEPERGWHCFGCKAGGTLYDLAAALWSEGTRGEAFKRLRASLLEEFVA